VHLERRIHWVDFPAGPPRPQINRATGYGCGVRTGVGNLLMGSNVWRIGVVSPIPMRVLFLFLPIEPFLASGMTSGR
jgi:hypothetical protein